MPSAQIACCYWFTGLSGAGKSTLTALTARELTARGVLCYVLDGDQLRTGLNADLGFSRSDRRENIRRIGEVARLMVDAGLVVLVGAISPYGDDRQLARERIGVERCFEVFVDADLETCKRRDTKGLYAKAQAGLISQFTGLSDPYEAPTNPHLWLDTTKLGEAQACAQVVEHYVSVTPLIR
jgi:adenylyl-sulfate kinase